MIFISIIIIHTSIPIIIISILFIIINLWDIRNKKITSIHKNSGSYGTVYYPAAVLILTIILWSQYKIILALSVLIMSISDSFAGIIGTRYGKKYFTLVREKKSVSGSTAMFISTFLIIFIALTLLYNMNLFIINLILAFMISATITLSELLSSKGNDNVIVPIVAAIFIYGYLFTEPDLKYQLIFGQLLSLAICLLSYYFKFLKVSGAVVSFLLGSIIFGFGGIEASIPILTFFISSSLLSKAGKNKKKSLEISYEKSGIRDYGQVLANGIIPGVIVLLMTVLKENNMFIAYISAVSIAMADTWATELGMFSKNKPILLTNFKRVNHGTSGAVSVAGSAAASLGSLIIALSGFLFFKRLEIDIDYIKYFIIIMFSGLSGCFIDSFIGATVQSQYKCHICLKITEKMIHCNSKSDLIRGFRFLNNDLVNFLSIFITTIIAYSIIYIII